MSADLIAALREIISAQRETIAAKNALIVDLQAMLEENVEAVQIARAIIDGDRVRRAEQKR